MKPSYHLRALALDFLGDIAIVFERAGHSIYLVGGSVRDRILGRAAPDLDLATSALPEEISRLLRQSGGKAIVEIGSAFGTVCARFGDRQVDVTTFRSEWYPDPESRHPQVQFGTSLRQDLQRRDFTINAIAQDISSGRLIDPFDGVGDIARRRVRAVGHAEDRFTEDPLRMMRAIRLAAQLDMDIDAPTRSAIAASAGRLQFISAERIRAELEKILLAEDPAGSLADLIDLGLCRFVIPELLELAETDNDERSRQKDVLSHTLRVVNGVRAHLPLRLAALLHDIGKPATRRVRGGKVHFFRHELVGARMARRILGRLRFDRATTDEVGSLVALHMRSNLYSRDWTDGAVRRYLREVGGHRELLLELSRADITSYRHRKIRDGLARVAELEARCERLGADGVVARMRSPLDGNDLMKLLDRPPGPWIKPLKEHLLGLVLDGQLDPDDRERAAALAVQLVEPGDQPSAAPAPVGGEPAA